MALFEARGLHKRFGDRVVLEEIDLTFEAGGLGEIAVGMKGGFHPVAEIRETVERRRQTFAIKKKGREPAGGVFVSRGREPGLNISLHARFDSQCFEFLLKPWA